MSTNTVRRNLACFPLLAFAALMPTASAAPSVPASVCQTDILNDEEAEAVCTLPNLGAGGVARFKANLLGSHDDSIASLSMILLNGTPIKCREGSKTESRFEDGEVTLDCGFSTPAPLIGGQLKVKISLHHLQLNRTELALE